MGSAQGRNSSKTELEPRLTSGEPSSVNGMLESEINAANHLSVSQYKGSKVAVIQLRIKEKKNYFKFKFLNKKNAF